jgi:SAM-dependent methyltransferase
MNIDDLIPLLQCPGTKEPLVCHDQDGRVLRGPEGITYPVVRGVPVFTEEGCGVCIHADSHLSNSISRDAQYIIESTSGMVLNLSAGGTATKHSNVVELEYSIFRHTDVVGDAHQLPFLDNIFDACICMNAFEHYRQPHQVAKELLRVLKPGGTFFMHTAALQPIHEAPHHYYNTTRYGLAAWLEGFDVQHIKVSDNFNPAYALSWLISEIERGMAGHHGFRAAKQLRSARLGEVMEFWRDPRSRKGKLWDLFINLDLSTLEACAAGWEALARKPL